MALLRKGFYKDKAYYVSLPPCRYGVGTISRLLKMTGLFCRILSLLQGSFAKETYNLKEPTTGGHPIGGRVVPGSQALQCIALQCMAVQYICLTCVCVCVCVCVFVQPKIKALCGNTRAVQRGAETVMTDQYKGRRVNIVGDINTVLSGA